MHWSWKCHNDERFQVRSSEENVESKSNKVIMTIIQLDPGFGNLSKALPFFGCYYGPHFDTVVLLCLTSVVLQGYYILPCYYLGRK